MYRFIICFLLELLLIRNTYSQRITYLNFDYKNNKLNSISGLINYYLSNPNHSDTLWSEFDRKHYKSVDILKNALGLDGSLYSIHFTANILDIAPMGNGYLAKVLFYWNKNDSASRQEKIVVLGIANYLIVNDSGKYLLSNYLNYASKNWYVQNFGRIKYVYYPEHPFDFFKAHEANQFLNKIQQWFDIDSKDTLTYFIAPNCTGIEKLSGFDYFEGDGGDDLNLCGYFDDENNIIYSTSIAGENYKHELIHIINRHYPNAHELLKMGLAAYIDDYGSKNKSFTFHLIRYMKYIQDNNLSLNNYLSLAYYDEITNPKFVFGGLICNALLRKGGLTLLKKAMENTKTDKDLNAFLESHLNIKDYTQFFKNESELFIHQPGALLSSSN